MTDLRQAALKKLADLGQEIEQEPTPWRDMIVATLVREGINKHKARELADHFAAQPEPTCPECKAAVLYECVACSSNNYPPKSEQEPVGWEHHEYRPYGGPGEIRIHCILASQYMLPDGSVSSSFQWLVDQYRADKNTIKLIPLYATPPAAQRPWQGLIDEEVQFYIKKHSKLVNAGYDKATDTNLVAKTFDSTGFYKEVSTALKERNT
jgi:hypothetical protein